MMTPPTMPMAIAPIVPMIVPFQSPSMHRRLLHDLEGLGEVPPLVGEERADHHRR